MTGYLGPGVVNPMSRVTVASLADMGYLVNISRADPYTPSLTTSLVVAPTSSKSASLSNLTVTVDTTEDFLPAQIQLPLEWQRTQFEPPRRQVFAADVQRFDRDAVDAAMTTVSEQDEEKSKDIYLSGDTDMSLAWEDLASVKPNWRAVALASAS